MPPFRPLPQELIDKVIDELGEAYRDANHHRYSDHRIVACEALHACALVSRDWTGRSRMHLFKRIRIRADDSGKIPIPPKPIMPYVTKLRMQLKCKHYWLYPRPKLLRLFYTAPITYLGITEAALTPAQACLTECITALSATLRTVKFESCLLPPALILDIALGHPDLKQLHLICCEVTPTNSNPRPIPLLDKRRTDLELGVLSTAYDRSQYHALIAVAQLPVQFSGLDFDFMRDPRVTGALNAVIQANKDSLSSLTVQIFTPVSWNEPLFSLTGCLNLSKLTLDMEETGLCLVTTSTDILSTFDSTQCTRLKWIKLITRCIHQRLNQGSQNRLAQAWNDLDMILSELAKVASSVEGEKLTLVLASAHKKCVSSGRKRLPEYLPRFHGLGELRVEHEPGCLEVDAGQGCSYDHESVSIEGGYGNPSQN